jgi:hypothetical protein
MIKMETPPHAQRIEPPGWVGAFYVFLVPDSPNGMRVAVCVEPNGNPVGECVIKPSGSMEIQFHEVLPQPVFSAILMALWDEVGL